MLQIRNLNISHRKDLRTIVNDFSFALNIGDRAVIIGEEGNGKSTLLKWIVDPDLIAPYAEASGERICEGEKIGYLPQELPVEDRQKSIYDYFCEEMFFWEQTPAELGALARELHLPKDFYYRDQKVGTLSGGEKIKLQMARILMSHPSALLLDEPSNDIDLETLAWLERQILASDVPVLYISHDETLIERTANVIIHMEQIKRKSVSRHTIVRTGYLEYMKNRGEQFEKQRAEARNERRQEKIRQEKFRQIQQRVEHEQNAVSRQDPHGGQLLKKKMKAVKSLEYRYEREAKDMTRMPEAEEAVFIKFGENIRMPSGKTVLDLHLKELSVCKTQKSLTYSLKNGREDQTEGTADTVLAKDITLRVRGSEKVCIIGKNGAGKTTLLRKIAQELLLREDIHAAYMPQNYDDLLDMEKTPVEFLCVTGDKEEITRIRTYLGSMKYTAEEMSHPMAELSGGQKAKALLLKMSMSGADVLILDEPTRNFSPLSGPVIRAVLAAYGGAVISISHDRKYISQVCETVYELTPDGLIKREEGEAKVRNCLEKSWQSRKNCCKEDDLVVK